MAPKSPTKNDPLVRAHEEAASNLAPTMPPLPATQPPAGIGHNQIAGDYLLSFIERVQRLEEEISTLNHSKSDVYREARAHGFDVATMRAVLKEMKVDPDKRRERQEVFDLYFSAVKAAQENA